MNKLILSEAGMYSGMCNDIVSQYDMVVCHLQTVVNRVHCPLGYPCEEISVNVNTSHLCMPSLLNESCNRQFVLN